MLRGTSLKKDYGRITVLKGVDIDVAEGEAHVVIGPNGAGKTTLFKVLSGEVFPTSGTVSFDGRDVTRLAGWQRTRHGVGRTFQMARIFKELSAFENLVVALEAKKRQGTSALELLRLVPAASIRDEARRILAEFSLEHVSAWPAGSLSHGDKKTLELAMVLAARPRLLMLDEPTAGMSPADRQRSVELIAGLMKGGGLSLLLTEHDMQVVFGLATRITVLNYGEIIATGSPEEVRSNPRVREVYLGHDVSAA
ncbi:MAG: ABC transporter ATP-binding protein [Rhizobiaceae bacterium]|nr:ABC transporter ATP-binding protein [Rhizobiaceae bacterium]